MNRLSKLSLLLALGATVCAAGCKTAEDNPVTPDVLKKLDEGRARAGSGPSGSTGGDPRAATPDGGHTSPSGK